MKEDVKVFEFDKYEFGILVNSLVCFNNKLLEENKDNEPVADLLRKIVEEPLKKNAFSKVLKKDRKWR